MSNTRDRCRITGKPIFLKQEAHAAMAAYGRAKGAKRTYICEFCDGYHMTSKSRRANPGKVKR